MNDGAGSLADRFDREYLLADADRLAGNYAEAENILTTILSSYPKSGILLTQRSVVYAQEGKYDLAEADADLAVQNAPDDYIVLNSRCWMRAVAGKELDAAAEDCKKALGLHHDDSAILDSMAFVDFKRGDMKAALDGYNAALSASSHQWSSLYMRGIVKCQMGDTAGGDADIADAISHSNYIADEFAGYGVPKPDMKAALQ